MKDILSTLFSTLFTGWLGIGLIDYEQSRKVVNKRKVLVFKVAVTLLLIINLYDIVINIYKLVVS